MPVTKPHSLCQECGAHESDRILLWRCARCGGSTCTDCQTPPAFAGESENWPECWHCARESTSGREAACPRTDRPAHDPVNHPSHYNVGGLEVIDALEAWGCGFCDGNVIKYVARHRRKGAPLEDLKKARWYLDRLIADLENEP